MKIQFSSLLIISLLVGAMVLSGWFLGRTALNENHSVESVDVLMRNVSWGTELGNFVPYQKNDNLEFVFIAESDTGNIANIDIGKLKDKIDITSISVNDQPKREWELSWLPFDKAIKITIRGKARDNTATKEWIRNSLGIEFLQKDAKKAGSEKAEVQKPTGKLPENVTVPSAILSSNIDNLIPVSGNNLAEIDHVIVGDKTFVGSMKDETYYFIVPKDTFGNGENFVGLYLKNGQLLSTETKLDFVYNSSPINIAAITPKEVKNTQDQYVVLQGNGFGKMISIQLSNNLIFQNTLFDIINDHVVSIKIPKGLQPGEYYFNMMDSSGIYAAKNTVLTIR